MGRDKNHEEISKRIMKQTKERHVAPAETSYVDASRNISVNLSDSELSKALKNFDKEVDYERLNFLP